MQKQSDGSKTFQQRSAILTGTKGANNGETDDQ